MRKLHSAVIGIIILASAALRGWAVEATWNYAVEASATVQSAPPQITLSWPQDTTAVPNSYTVYRKAPGATSWGSGTALPGSATSYLDTGVAAGTAYEYQIVKSATGYNGYGYVQTGINGPLVQT